MILEVEVRIFIENASGDFLHQATHEFENNEAGNDNNRHNYKIGRGKEDKFEKVTNKRDNKSGDHDADDGEEKTGAEAV